MIDTRDTWCILRTSGQHTLALVNALRPAGFDYVVAFNVLTGSAPAS
ncbi:hypothetical protein [Sphingomonas nostoxanthinifaciens]|nr:hypothetical protein [Sphingomonas nostoxanthinifaciens]UAK25571.1 hypothetical protein K8P63_05300 [Sphingomonas nostoxanthinifaciens]